MAHHDDEIGGIDGVDLVGRELQIVRLRARGVRSRTVTLSPPAARAASASGKNDATTRWRPSADACELLPHAGEPGDHPGQQHHTENDSHDETNAEGAAPRRARRVSRRGRTSVEALAGEQLVGLDVLRTRVRDRPRAAGAAPAVRGSSRSRP